MEICRRSSFRHASTGHLNDAFFCSCNATCICSWPSSLFCISFSYINSDFFRLLLSASKLRRFYKPHPEVLGGFISVTQFRSRSICAPASHDIVRSSERVFFLSMSLFCVLRRVNERQYVPNLRRLVALYPQSVLLYDSSSTRISVYIYPLCMMRHGHPRAR